jgi:DNA topoisomerase IA
MEIEAFRAQEYWTVEAQLRTPRGKEFTARLVTHAGKKLDKFDLKPRPTPSSPSPPSSTATSASPPSRPSPPPDTPPPPS